MGSQAQLAVSYEANTLKHAHAAYLIAMQHLADAVHTQMIFDNEAAQNEVWRCSDDIVRAAGRELGEPDWCYHH